MTNNKIFPLSLELDLSAKFTQAHPYMRPQVDQDKTQFFFVIEPPTLAQARPSDAQETIQKPLQVVAQETPSQDTNFN